MDGRGLQREPRLVALDQVAFETAVNAVVSCLLTVVVLSGVERLVSVLNVVRRDRGKQHDVRVRVRRLPLEFLEGAAKVAELFRFAPRQKPVPLQRRLAELLQGGAVLPR